MGHAARRNATAQAAQRGELLSRRSIMGAMDHALELHAAALRLLEAKHVALKACVKKLEIMLKVEPVEALTRRVPVPCPECKWWPADETEYFGVERDGKFQCPSCGNLFCGQNANTD